MRRNMKKWSKRTGSALLAGMMCAALIGSNVLAAGGSYDIISGDNQTYTVGSGENWTVKIGAPVDTFGELKMDGTVVPEDKYTVTGNGEEVPPSEAPVPSEAPDPTSEAPYETWEPDPTSEAPYETWEPDPTSEAPYETWEPDPTGAPDATSEAPHETWSPVTAAAVPNPFNLFAQTEVQAAEVYTIISVSDTYMDTLSAGEHTFTAEFANGSAQATVYVEKTDEEETTEEEATEEEATEVEDETEDTTQEEATTEKKTETKKKSSSSKTGDETPVGMYLALAALSGGMILYIGRKKVTK